MESMCTFLNLKDKLCTNGFNNNSIKSYTNLQPNTEIGLKFGYTLKIISTDFSMLHFDLYNDFFTGHFSINANSCMLYSLPCEGGCYLLDMCYEKRCTQNMCCESGG